MNIIIQIILTITYMTLPLVILSIIMKKVENLKNKHKMVINEMYKEKSTVVYI